MNWGCRIWKPRAFPRRDVSARIDFLAGQVVRDIQREQTKEEGKEEGLRPPLLYQYARARLGTIHG